MRALLHAALAVLCLTAGLAVPATARAGDPVKVAVIVGPVGSLTPTYLALAEAAAATAERHGATVARAYSPNATPANVLAAVADAKVIVYFGHGYGHPSPYGGLNTARQNGWALQGPGARGTHDDSLNSGLAYYGEDWIMANARPAPGFVMIYSNTCYAPGASEGGHAPATPGVAAERVAYYSRKVFSMGGSAYFATDFDRGAADLVDRILGAPGSRYADVFTADHRFVAGGLTTQAHRFSAGQQIWLHRSKYTDGPPNYWYAFAGNPDATPTRSWDARAPRVSLARLSSAAADVVPWSEPQLRVDETVTGVDATTVRLLDPRGKPVAARVHHDPRSGRVRIVPKRDLALSTRYTIEVRGGIGDLAGNALAPARWTFSTRLDIDPWTTHAPMRLAEGRHRLARIAADGTVEKERVVDLTGERLLSARSRGRLPDSPGSWLEIGTGPLEGWWVVESARAHVVGRVGEVKLPRTSVRLPAEGAATLDGSSLPARVRVRVDRAAVVDGRLAVRARAGGTTAWILPPTGLTVDLDRATRVLERRRLPEPAEVQRLARRIAAFRFDDAGRVVDRRTITADDGPMEATATFVVAGHTFHLLGGRLEGWAVPGGDGAELVAVEVRDPS